ncbi:cytochrome c [Dechloromonas sp. XY25]|uniref:Cytochrome c n=1 Tax=Dechloromonas hankyongensis TaxID=2908002 RepID=A0ABS9K210_9RHOO|nr:cytochrome c [Dechloromonas hankyongensis]MCG2577188.1 cytochrome c [Dechloromonas hankyongensis]
MRKTMRMMLVAVLVTGAAGTVSAANFVQGQQLYQMHCAACHGGRGEGVMPDAPKFRMGERLDQPDMILMQSVKSGKKTMPPFFGILQDAQILDVLAYVRTLR